MTFATGLSPHHRVDVQRLAPLLAGLREADVVHAVLPSGQSLVVKGDDLLDDPAAITGRLCRQVEVSGRTTASALRVILALQREEMAARPAVTVREFCPPPTHGTPARLRTVTRRRERWWFLDDLCDALRDADTAARPLPIHPDHVSVTFLRDEDGGGSAALISDAGVRQLVITVDTRRGWQMHRWAFGVIAQAE